MRQQRIWQYLLVFLILAFGLSSHNSQAQAQPFITGSSPADGATGVHLDGFVAVTVFVPNGGIDTFTATPSTVRLVRTSDQSTVPANITVSGGGDAITVQPTVLLEANTNYTYSTTTGLKDVTGVSFTPFSMQFTTGTEYANPDSNIRFEKVSLPTAQGQFFSSLAIGPDGKLYASTLTGQIWRFVINADGMLGEPQIISSIQTSNGGDNRMIVGLAFDPASTAQNVIVWVSHSAFGFFDVPDWDGKITRMSGADLQTVQDYVVNLPRSARDHVTNSIAFGPDGALYVLQGSTSAMGAADAAWASRPEHQLSAALLRVNLAAITPPLNVKTEDAGVPGSGVYNAMQPGAPLTIWASGLRNSYDLVWHTNGQVYIPNNGSAAGGNVPATPAVLPASCTNRIDDALYGDYTGPFAPAISNVAQTQADSLFRVVQGGYYGHPNPTRCEWVMNGGNPTSGNDYLQLNQYPVGTQPDRNFRPASYVIGDNYSANGIIEYKSNVFDGQLAGKLLIARYSGGDDILVLEPGEASDNFDIVDAQTGYEGLTVLQDPLDLVENTANGNIYVSEYGGQRIRLLRPILTVPTPQLVLTPDRQIFSEVKGGAASISQPVTIANDGDSMLTVTSLALAGTNAGDFVLSGVPTLPFGVNPGQQVTVNVAFDPDIEGVKGASLQITSNDAAQPNASVNLRGLGTLGLSDQNEPSLQWILDTYEIAVTVGDDNPATTPIHSTVGGTAPLLGQEVSLPQFQVANAAAPVTVEALAAYGQLTDPVGQLGYYPIGSPNTRTQILEVPGGNAQTLNPVVNGMLSFNLPANTNFGVYTTWPAFGGRASFSQDALNTWEPQVNERHKLRVYPLRDSVGTLVPNAFIFTFEAYTEGFDYNDIVFVMRNVRPSVATGIIAFENRDWVALNALNLSGMNWINTRLVVSHIGSRVAVGSTSHAMHRDATLRILNNNPSATLSISSLTISDPARFALLNNETSINVAPNGFYDLVVRFMETSGTQGVRAATLTIVSNDITTPTSVIQLSGIYLMQPEGNEPTVSHVVQGFGFGTNVGSTGNFSALYQASGEEVLSRFWQRLDPSKPVYVRQIMALHPCCSQTSTVGAEFISGAEALTTHHQYWGQTIHPRIDGFGYHQPYTELSMERSEAFELVVDGRTSCAAECGQNHALRWWPARNASGTPIPGVYLVAMEYTGVAGVTSFDFNDNIYLVANVQPANSSVVDLVVAGNDSPDPVGVDNPLTYGLTVTNQGTVSAANVSLTLPLPTGVNFVSANTTFAGANCGYSVPNVTCTLGTLGGQTQAAITIVVTPTNLGSLSVTAQASTTTLGETSTANNQLTLNTTVNTPTLPPGQIIVVLDAQPAGQQVFNYTTTGLSPSSFVLSDNGGTPFNVNVNFQNATGAVPVGYLRDSGEAFGARTGANQGSGLNYGWVEATNSTGLNVSTLGRDRNFNADQRLDTMMHMQTDDIVTAFSGPKVEGRWEIAVPNGAYRVTVSAGDALIDVNSVNEARNTLNVEGVNAINQFVGVGSNGSNTRHTQATVTVFVSDGRLTVDAFGGFNTKINYIEIIGYSDRVVFSDVPVGTYAVTQSIATNWVLMGLVCVDPDNGSAIDLEPLRATIDLDSGETITCTFTNVESSGQPTATPTFTNTPTNTATFTATNTPTPEGPTHTPTETPTNTATFTATNTPTNTATFTATNTPTNTATFTATNTPTNTPTAVPGVAGLTLINTNTDQNIQPLVNGAVIDMSVTGNALTVRAQPTISFYSVRFTLSSGGTSLVDRYENYGPYSLFGDGNGTGGAGNFDYYPWLPVPQPGSYQLLIRLYSGGNGSGTLLANEVYSFTLTNGGGGGAPTATNTPTNTPTATATFTATNTPTNTPTGSATNTATNTPTNTPTSTPSNTPVAGQSISQLVLINADTDQPIGLMSDGIVLDLAAIGTSNLNIRADTNPAQVGSVRFSIDGVLNYKIENYLPYSIGGDSFTTVNTDYYAWVPPAGTHTLTVFPFTGGGASGTAGTPMVVQFTVINGGTSGITADNSLTLNSGFEAATTNAQGVARPEGWTGKNLTQADRLTCVAEGSASAQPNAAEGSCAFRFNSGTVNNQTRTLKQTFKPTEIAAGDTLTLRLAARAKQLQGKVYVQVRATFADGSTQAFRLNVKKGTYAYTGLSKSVSLRAAPVKVQVALVAKQSRGQVYIDDLALTHTLGGGGLLPLPGVPDLRGQ